MHHLLRVLPRARLADLMPLGLFLALVAAAFTLFFDASILNPGNIGWIAEGDLRQHYLGWVAIRQADTLGEPWGLSPLLAYPHGAPISSTDSNPLVSLALWPIEAWLPETFQFIGPWYLLSLALSLAFAAALLRHTGFGRASALLLGAVLAFQPILFWRYGHDTLTAQWLILAAFYVSLAIEPAFPRDAGIRGASDAGDLDSPVPVRDAELRRGFRRAGAHPAVGRLAFRGIGALGAGAVVG
jgi:hypothetical protein